MSVYLILLFLLERFGSTWKIKRRYRRRCRCPGGRWLHRRDGRCNHRGPPQPARPPVPRLPAAPSPSRALLSPGSAAIVSTGKNPLNCSVSGFEWKRRGFTHFPTRTDEVENERQPSARLHFPSPFFLGLFLFFFHSFSIRVGNWAIEKVDVYANLKTKVV